MWLKNRTRKRHKPHRFLRLAKIWVWRQGKQMKLRERIARRNEWASTHPKHVMLTVSCAMLLLLFFSFLPDWLGYRPPLFNVGNMVNEIHDIQPVFEGFRHINAAKEVHLNELTNLVKSGEQLKKEFDSLRAKPNKTHQDTLEMVKKYKQLELIVNSLNEEK